MLRKGAKPSLLMGMEPLQRRRAPGVPDTSLADVARGIHFPAGVEIDTVWIAEAPFGYVVSQALPRFVSFLRKQGTSLLVRCSKKAEHCFNRGSDALRILDLPRGRLVAQVAGDGH